MGWGLVQAEIESALVDSIVEIVVIAGCACEWTGIGLSNEVCSALCIHFEGEIIIRWVVPIDTVFTAGAEALVTARKAAVQLVLKIGFMLIVVEGIATFCQKLGPGPL